ncbi:MAG: hypothetical protein WAX69_05440 [Victivallales bacterium]
MKIILACIIIGLAAFGCTKSSDDTPSIKDSKKLINFKEKGIARAKEDIANGKMKILYYGKPWSQGKPLVDDNSGLPIEIVSGCSVTPEFQEETDSYNDTMRKKAKEKLSQQ